MKIKDNRPFVETWYDLELIIESQKKYFQSLDVTKSSVVIVGHVSPQEKGSNRQESFNLTDGLSNSR